MCIGWPIQSSKSNTKPRQNFGSSLKAANPRHHVSESKLKGKPLEYRAHFCQASHSQLSKLSLENKTTINGQKI